VVALGCRVPARIKPWLFLTGQLMSSSTVSSRILRLPVDWNVKIVESIGYARLYQILILSAVQP
jgi:hypothetical protein